MSVIAPERSDTFVWMYPGGGGVLPEKLGRGVRPASQNPYPTYDQNLWFSLPYLWPDQKYDLTLFRTCFKTVSLVQTNVKGNVHLLLLGRLQDCLCKVSSSEFHMTVMQCTVNKIFHCFSSDYLLAASVYSVWSRLLVVYVWSTSVQKPQEPFPWPERMTSRYSTYTVTVNIICVGLLLLVLSSMHSRR